MNVTPAGGGGEVGEEQKPKAGPKSDEHGCGDVRLRKHVQKDVPGIHARETKDALLIGLKKGIAEGHRPQGNLFFDFCDVGYIKKDVNGERPKLAAGPCRDEFSRGFGIRESRQSVKAAGDDKENRRVMGENGQVKGDGDAPHDSKGFFLEGPLEKIESGGHAAQQQGIFADFSRQGDLNWRKGDNNESKKARCGAKKQLKPFKCEPAKCRSGEDQGEAQHKFRAADQMTDIEQKINQRRMRVAETRLVSQKEGRLIDEQVVEN